MTRYDYWKVSDPTRQEIFYKDEQLEKDEEIRKIEKNGVRIQLVLIVLAVFVTVFFGKVISIWLIACPAILLGYWAKYLILPQNIDEHLTKKEK